MHAPPIFQVLCPDTKKHLRIYADGRVDGWDGRQSIVINLIPDYLMRAYCLGKEGIQEGGVAGDEAASIFPRWADGWPSPDLVGQAFGIGCEEEVAPERAALMLAEHARKSLTLQHQHGNGDSALK